MTNDTRYPYTYSCDFIRQLGPVGRGGVVLSRSDASQIRQGIAAALGIADADLACKLADVFLKQEEDPAHAEHLTQRVIAALNLSYP